MSLVKKICIAWLMLLLACSSSYSADDDFDLGNFDNNGVLHNKAERAYRLPDIGAFLAVYPKPGDLALGLSLELFDENDWKIDFVVSEQRLGFSLGRKIFPVIDITVAGVFSRNFNTNEYQWGLSVGLVKF